MGSQLEIINTINDGCNRNWITQLWRRTSNWIYNFNWGNSIKHFLIIGFTIHNTTEGLAIISPLAKSQKKINIGRLAILGLIAGAPTILGTWIGGFLYYPIATAIFIAIGAGAIFQVVYQIYSWFSTSSLYSAEGKKVYDDG